jgi:hypothetical protein
MQARAMIVVMRSPNHKKEAMIRIKRFLAQKKIRDVSINDCFPNDTLDKAKALARYGAAQRRAGGIIRYRVVNKQGQAVLQMLKEGGNFKDANISEEQLEPYRRAAQPMETDAQESNTTRSDPNNTGARQKDRQKSTSGSNNVPLMGNNKQTSKQPATRRPVVPQPGTSASAGQDDEYIQQQLAYWREREQQKNDEAARKEKAQQRDVNNYANEYPPLTRK